jgi:MFS family permease
MFGALRYYNYRLWFFGQMVSLMGTWMQSVAQGWLVYQLTGSELALGTISFIGALPTLVLMLPAGVVVDRVPKRTVLLATQTAMMLLAFALAALAASGVLQVWHVAVLAVGLGVVNSFDAPARQSLAVEMVEDRRDMMNAIAMNSTMFNIARIAGPALAGIVLAAVGTVWCFALNGLSFLAVIAGLWAMRLPGKPGIPHHEGVRAQMMVGLRYVWQNVSIRAIITVMGVSCLTAMSYGVLLPVFAADVFHAGEKGLGALNAAMGAGALLGSLTVAAMGGLRRKGLLLTAGNLLFPLLLLGFAFSPSYAVALAALVLVGWAMMAQNATANTLVQATVPDELRGRVMAAYSLVFFGSSPFGSLQIGALAQALGPVMAVAISAGVNLAYALYTLLAVPKVRRMEA